MKIWIASVKQYPDLSENYEEIEMQGLGMTRELAIESAHQRMAETFDDMEEEYLLENFFVDWTDEVEVKQ